MDSLKSTQYALGVRLCRTARLRLSQEASPPLSQVGEFMCASKMRGESSHLNVKMLGLSGDAQNHVMAHDAKQTHSPAQGRKYTQPQRGFAECNTFSARARCNLTSCFLFSWCFPGWELAVQGQATSNKHKKHTPNNACCFFFGAASTRLLSKKVG